MPKKSLGQHWLKDEATLDYIADAAGLMAGETVLEVGPGTGTLTKKLLERGVQVIAVEKDPELIKYLTSQVSAENLRVVNEDILRFDLSQLPAEYKVVANIPYYLTSNLLRMMSESENPPSTMTLLVQREVAERICAGAGQMSILAVSVQLYYNCNLGKIVPAALFEPPPKVDSQVVILQRREVPLFTDLDNQKLFRIVKAGFAERRKKLRSSLAGGLHLSREDTDELLKRAGIDGNLRAQELPLEAWHKIYRQFPGV